MAVLRDENLGHLVPGSLGGTGEASRPFYYIGARMLGGALPASCLVVALVVALAGRTFRVEARRPLIFQLGLVIAVLGLFSIANSKRDDYILPAMPGLAILFSSLFTQRSPKAEGRVDNAARIADWTAAIVATGALAIVLGVLGDVEMLRETERSLRGQSSDAAYASIAVQGFEQFRAPFVLFLGATAAGALVVLTGL